MVYRKFKKSFLEISQIALIAGFFIFFTLSFSVRGWTGFRLLAITFFTSYAITTVSYSLKTSRFLPNNAKWLSGFIILIVLNIIRVGLGILIAQLILWLTGVTDTIFIFGYNGYFYLLPFSILVALLSNVHLSQKLKIEKACLDIRSKERQKEEMAILIEKANLEALQSKINPHFLCNSLNSIAELISIYPDKAEEMTVKLAHLFHSTLKFNSDAFSSLEEEISLIRSYLTIEKVRFGVRLDYIIAVEPGLSTLKIPQLLLQPLVENAVLHGISPLVNGGKIDVKCIKRDQYCKIIIQDNGVGMEASAPHGYGLTNVKKKTGKLVREMF